MKLLMRGIECFSENHGPRRCSKILGSAVRCRTGSENVKCQNPNVKSNPKSKCQNKELYHENTKHGKHEKLNSSLSCLYLTCLAALSSMRISFLLRIYLFFRTFVIKSLFFRYLTLNTLSHRFSANFKANAKPRPLSSVSLLLSAFHIIIQRCLQRFHSKLGAVHLILRKTPHG